MGAVGAVALILAVIGSVLSGNARIARSRIADERRLQYALVCAMVILLYLAAFVRLPHLTAYFIPAIPFILLLVALLLGARAFSAVCIALIASPFVGISASGFEDGPLLHDRRARIELMETAALIVSRGNGLPGQNVVIAGHWSAPVWVYATDAPRQSVEYVYLLDRSQLEAYRRRGVNLYYAPGQRG